MTITKTQSMLFKYYSISLISLRITDSIKRHRIVYIEAFLQVEIKIIEITSIALEGILVSIKVSPSLIQVLYLSRQIKILPYIVSFKTIIGKHICLYPNSLYESSITNLAKGLRLVYTKLTLVPQKVIQSFSVLRFHLRPSLVGPLARPCKHRQHQSYGRCCPSRY